MDQDVLLKLAEKLGPDLLTFLYFREIFQPVGVFVALAGLVLVVVWAINKLGHKL